MDLLQKLGPLALGSRLKRISDLLFDEVQKVYSAQGIDLSSRCFPVLYALHTKDSQLVTGVAQQLGLSHAAVSQVVKELRKLGLVQIKEDARDGRRSVLVLSAKARKITKRLEIVWKHIGESIQEVIDESGGQLLEALLNFDRSLTIRTLHERVNDRLKTDTFSNVSIVTWQPQYARDFEALNREWLGECGYKVEPTDILSYQDPEEAIIRPGGMIFFALLNNAVVGTCSMIANPHESFELAKMAVTRGARGHGIGRRLVNTALVWAKTEGASTVVLETSSKLKEAQKLYQSVGFLVEDTKEMHYERADIRMKKVL